MSGEFRGTYRLQLTPDFGFRAARELVPYLTALGVSHLYLSPSLEARQGSTHGYDVVDPRRVSQALGGEEELRALGEAGLEIVLDIVPNHMATGGENPFWADPDLRARFFDVDTRTGLHRRFFDIGDLGGVRVEDEAVVATTHAKALELVRDGVVAGLRIDHAGAEHPLTDLYAELTGESRPFAAVASEAKLEQAAGTFEPELRRLFREALALPNLQQAACLISRLPHVRRA